MKDDSELYSLWCEYETAKDRERSLAMRNTSGLTTAERFALDVEYQRALREQTEAWLAYQRALFNEST